MDLIYVCQKDSQRGSVILYLPPGWNRSSGYLHGDDGGGICVEGRRIDVM